MLCMTDILPKRELRPFAQQQGVTMIEVLIAVLLFAVGILGIAGLQLSSLSALTHSHQLSIAVLGSNDMADRMRANLQAIDQGAYDAITGTEVDPACGVACSTQQVAQLDAFQVRQMLDEHLSQPSVTVTRISPVFDLFTIAVSWDDVEKSLTERKEHKVTVLFPASI